MSAILTLCTWREHPGRVRMQKRGNSICYQQRKKKKSIRTRQSSKKYKCKPTSRIYYMRRHFTTVFIQDFLISRNNRSTHFGYQKIELLISRNHFLISRNRFLDIKKYYFLISGNRYLDIKNSISWYQEFDFLISRNKSRPKLNNVFSLYIFCVEFLISWYQEMLNTLWIVKRCLIMSAV